LHDQDQALYQHTHTQRHRQLIRAIFAVCLLSTTTYQANDSFYTLELELSQDSNVGLAIDDEHVKSDNIISAYADYGFIQELDVDKRLTYTASLESVNYSDYPELDHIDFGGNIAYQQKMGIGETAPSFLLSAAIVRRECNFDVRDSWFYNVSAGVQKNLNDRWFGSMQLRYENRNADSNDSISMPGPGPGPSPGPGPNPGPGPGPGMTLSNNAFDLTNIELGFNAEFAASDFHFLNIGYTYRDGEVASLGQPDEQVRTFATAASQALEFLDKDPSDPQDLFIYRIDAKSHVVNVGWDYILNDRSSLGLSYQFQQTEASGGLDYDRNVIALKYVYGN